MKEHMEVVKNMSNGDSHVAAFATEAEANMFAAEVLDYERENGKAHGFGRGSGGSDGLFYVLVQRLH